MFKIYFSLVFIFALLFLSSAPLILAQSACSSGSTLNIVAHEDDDLLFLSPDLITDIRAKRCVTTVFVTAGDANLGNSYWRSREDGVKAAYALMAGESNSWKEVSAGINKTATVFTLRSNSSISLVFLRLPDGNWDGSGFSNNNNESIKKLWQGNISSIKTVDGAAAYSKQDLISALLSLMNKYNPDKIKTQNYVDGYSGADHSDHFTAAYAAFEAHKQYSKAHNFSGYLGYATSSRSANLSGGDLTLKKNAFYLYGNYDANVCNSALACQSSSYGAWLERQYIVGSINSGSNPSPSPSPSSSPTSTPRPTATPRNTPTPRPTATPRNTPTPTPTTQVLKWNGNVAAKYTERYEFCMEGNQGFRLWVDGDDLIDEWDEDDSTDECDSIRLTAGKNYQVRVEARESSAKLYWESKSQTKQIIPTNF